LTLESSRSLRRHATDVATASSTPLICSAASAARRAGTNPLAECARDHSRTWAAARRVETSCWSGLRESSAVRSLPHLPCHHALVDRLAIAALARVDHLEIASQGVRLQANRWPKEHGDRPRPSIVSTRLKRIGGQATEDSQATPTGRLTGRGLSINCVVVADVAVLLAILLGLS